MKEETKKAKVFDRDTLVNTVINQLQKEGSEYWCMAQNVLEDKTTIKQRLTMDFFYVLKTLTVEEKMRVRKLVFDITLGIAHKDNTKSKSTNVSINDALNQKYAYPNDEYYWSDMGWRYKKELFVLEDDGKYRSYSQLPPKKRPRLDKYD